ncbi:MAG: hypothetical protein A3H69_03570 [Candidatus Sungbacteria bacterium RIFCSPLOWO2_02_FULL_47_9]|uniref:Uncharacterized protein n=1 Tax=Candidatus Sungbacteria bacterium RIFCSPHIGHO2_01_FULL_47_32 TaxID=1802264 RepID=A0A1G2K924_9BACT|nr:MAG: hypothetical protein A2633_02490 [Candidatus Sungbacteria bacterium RIFCSPHIGHO2_01_FULL_47_32]OGZ98894.1 MAG: hypothetical protein A3D57_01875 [Candidatus Sungbacteria bacterium RIFCSPHIGHO2_02_FULL_46_12]OHA06189.1 MAG: hypothetical protein A3A28_01095 [Candidatus Sungbacteria bacterium RIFCSPLOWO2_01_FULL_47_32]OHA12081.1 MAG: hypothetical protein A3H69_03570 [Candidatus Sungbacteria bacterium RIFCSPLOWO2_02_FULL_47_9]
MGRDGVGLILLRLAIGIPGALFGNPSNFSFWTGSGTGGDAHPPLPGCPFRSEARAGESYAFRADCPLEPERWLCSAGGRRRANDSTSQPARR